MHTFTPVSCVYLGNTATISVDGAHLHIEASPLLSVKRMEPYRKHDDEIHDINANDRYRL